MIDIHTTTLPETTSEEYRVAINQYTRRLGDLQIENVRLTRELSFANRAIVLKDGVIASQSRDTNQLRLYCNNLRLQIEAARAECDLMINENARLEEMIARLEEERVRLIAANTQNKEQ